MDLAILRVCRANGWTRRKFDALTDAERVDWLAYDDWKRQQKLGMLRSMRALIDEGKSVDGGAYAAVWLSLLEG
jgi:hypothetical protein